MGLRWSFGRDLWNRKCGFRGHHGGRFAHCNGKQVFLGHYNGRFAHCDVWKKDYRNKENIREHIRTIYEGRFANCDVWGKYYWNEECIKEHVRAVHEGRFAHCDVRKEDFGWFYRSCGPTIRRFY